MNTRSVDCHPYIQEGVTVRLIGIVFTCRGQGKMELASPPIKLITYSGS